MSDIDLLQDLIREEALALIVTNRYGNKEIVLEEIDHRDQPKYILRILNVPDNVIAFKTDLFPAPSSIFKNTKGECKRSDYVIIASDDTNNWIVYIEMERSSTKSKTEIEQQLRGAFCLVKYCRAVGQQFWRMPEFLNQEHYRELFVSVKDIAIKKRTTSFRSTSGDHDAPERMLRIKAPAKGRLRFNQLIERS